METKKFPSSVPLLVPFSGSRQPLNFGRVRCDENRCSLQKVVGLTQVPPDNPSKLEWDLTNGPLSCDQAVGSGTVLLEISWR